MSTHYQKNEDAFCLMSKSVLNQCVKRIQKNWRQISATACMKLSRKKCLLSILANKKIPYDTCVKSKYDKLSEQKSMSNKFFQIAVI